MVLAISLFPWATRVSARVIPTPTGTPTTVPAHSRRNPRMTPTLTRTATPDPIRSHPRRSNPWHPPLVFPVRKAVAAPTATPSKTPTLEDKLSKIGKIERKTLRVAPRLLALTHDRMVETWIVAEMGFTRIEAFNLYAQPTDEVRYDLKYSYDTGPFIGSLFLKDRVEFNKRVGDLRFIGRERKGGVEFQFPLYGPLSFRGGGVGAEYTTIPAKDPDEIHRSQILLGDGTLGIFSDRRGIRFTFRQGLWWGASDYHPQWIEGEANWRWPLSERKWLVQFHGKAGTPVRHPEEDPLYEWYYVGGWETLRGWPLYRFAGPSAVMGDMTARIPLSIRKPRKGHPVAWFSQVYAFGTIQTAAVGDRTSLQYRDSYHVSASLGAVFEVAIKGASRFFVEAAWAKAMREDPKPMLYLTGGVR